MDDFQLYLDKNLQEQVSNPINFGKVKAGDSKQYLFYIYNSSLYPYEELKFIIDNPEVKVISAPSELLEKTSAELVLEWNPSVDIKRGLKTLLKIEGYQVIG